jgi:MoaA/NifB/PqqE/SkfB family radical SAM enzyme
MIIDRIKEWGVKRIVFTGGDPLQRPDAPLLIKYAKAQGVETALSTTGDFVTPAILAAVAPVLDLISLPLDGSTETINAKTKHRPHYEAVMQALDLLRAYPTIDVKVCTPVTRHNVNDVTNIAALVEDYAASTQARVFYNVFQAFPRAMFAVKWEELLVEDEVFAGLAAQIGTGDKIKIHFLSHHTLDKLYVMVFPDGSMVIPKGADYLNFGPFLEVEDLEQVLAMSEFDVAKHLRHSRGWGKRRQEMLTAGGKLDGRSREGDRG